MRTSLVVLMVALVAGSLLSGCLGGDEKDPDGGGDECGARCDPNLISTEGSGLGIIRGKVVDESFDPVAGANVTLREASLATKTNTEGRFAFNDLPPGLYTVYAQKSGFLANGKQVTVVADQFADADLMLEELPPYAPPFSVDHGLFAGIIGCTVIVPPISPPDICRRITDIAGTTDENHVNEFKDLHFASGTNAVAVKMNANPQLTTADIQLLQRWNFGDMALQIPDLKGHPPASAVWEWPIETAPDFTKKNATGGFTVTATGDFGDPPQVAYEHAFEVYVVTFHNGMVVPDGFEAGPDQ